MQAASKRAKPRQRAVAARLSRREFFERHVTQAQRKAILAMLVEKAQGGDWNAAKFVFEGLYGRPAQRTEQSGPEGGPQIIRIEYVDGNATDADPACEPAQDSPGGTPV